MGIFGFRSRSIELRRQPTRSCRPGNPGAVDHREDNNRGYQGGVPIQPGRLQLRPGRRATPADRPDPGRKRECDKTPAQGMFLVFDPGSVEDLPGKSSCRRPGTSSSTRAGGCSPESRRQPSGLSGQTRAKRPGRSDFRCRPDRGSYSTRPQKHKNPPPVGG